MIAEIEAKNESDGRPWGTLARDTIRILIARVRELEGATMEAASTLQDLAASCRHYEHLKAATAAEVCEQHIRVVLTPPSGGAGNG